MSLLYIPAAPLPEVSNYPDIVRCPRCDHHMLGSDFLVLIRHKLTHPVDP